MNRNDIAGCRRIVIKVGTSTVTHATGKINLHRMERLAREISDISSMGREVVLISSGAVGAGLGKLNRAERPRTLPEKQAMAYNQNIEYWVENYELLGEKWAEFIAGN